MTGDASPLTDQPVNRMLLLMAAPISLGMLSTFLFQIVDTYFVGQLGSAELAALAFASTAYFLAVSVFIGFSIGVSAAVARAMGAGERQKARRLTSLALVVVLLLSVSGSWVGRHVTEPMFAALGAAPDITPLIVDYMHILYLGLPFLMLGIVGSGALRAAGFLKVSEVIFGIAGVINLVFDYVLIFGIGPFPEMGLAGAATATMLSFVFIFAGITVVLIRVKMMGASGLKSWREGATDLLEIARLAVPTIAVQILVPATGMLTTFLLAGYGSQVVAAYGVASRIEALALIGIFAVSAAITPFVAQNFGAGQHDRIDRAVIYAGKASIYLGIGLFVILALAGPLIARVFSDDPAVISFVGLYFKIVAVSYGFFGLINVTAAIFNGLQMPSRSLKLMLVRTFVITVPLLVATAYISITAMLVALAAGNVLSGLYAGYLMRQSERQWNRPIADASPLQDIVADIKSLFRRS